MYKEDYGKFVAEIAKEVVVAQSSSATSSFGAQGGKQLADYYNAVYDNIYENLSKTLLSE